MSDEPMREAWRRSGSHDERRADAAHGAPVPPFTSTRMLDSVIPGLGLMAPLLTLVAQGLQAFDVDVTQLAAVLIAVVGALTTTRYLWSRVLAPLCSSSVAITADDDVYEEVMAWLARQRVTERSRHLMIRSKSAWEETDRYGRPEKRKENRQFKPRYEPSFGNHHFWYKGNYFILRRSLRQDAGPIPVGNGSGDNNPKETLTIDCISLTPRPIKMLIEEATKAYSADKANHTSIRVPANNRDNGWKKLSAIPSRSIETLCLAGDQKEALVQDLTQFLDPAEQAWYRERGIPYRRGYLFHGPPGTGKTSLSHVMAGMFGLDIHVINLLEPTLSEFKLTSLFQNMPPRCVVLLEDIDSAGLEQRNAPRPSLLSRGTQQVADDAPQSAVSLSCLLNIIDGLVAHEGRILFMTTNYPERLDSALVRPGRVDMKVLLELAVHSQIRALFLKMYSENGDDEDQQKRVDMQANEFASLLKERTFSPADIQGYLLTHRGQPGKALDEAAAWQDALLLEREQKAQAAAEAAVEAASASEMTSVAEAGPAPEILRTRPERGRRTRSMATQEAF